MGRISSYKKLGLAWATKTRVPSGDQMISVARQVQLNHVVELDVMFYKKPGKKTSKVSRRADKRPCFAT